jgi:O-antigen/teichoic acid export membrane protein
MAITAKEKVLQMLPYMIAQVAINLLLDWLLIPRWGMPGGVAAVTLTWIVTIPFRILAVRRIVGNIPFPIGFLVRVATLSAAIAGALWWAWDKPRLPGLAIIATIFFASFVVLGRLARVVRADDCADLQGIVSGKLRKAVGWLAGQAGQR